MNSKRTKSCYWGGLHAEIDALRKIKKHDSKRPLDVNIIVLRVNKIGDISLSQPCHNCIKKMEKFQEYKNCRIEYIIFSKTNNILQKIKLKNIKNLPIHISTAFKK